MNGLIKDRHSLDQIIDDEQTQTLKIIKEEKPIVPDRDQAKVEDFAVYKQIGQTEHNQTHDLYY